MRVETHECVHRQEGQGMCCRSPGEESDESVLKDKDNSDPGAARLDMSTANFTVCLSNSRSVGLKDE